MAISASTAAICTCGEERNEASSTPTRVSPCTLSAAATSKKQPREDARTGKRPRQRDGLTRHANRHNGLFDGIHRAEASHGPVRLTIRERSQLLVRHMLKRRKDFR